MTKTRSTIMNPFSKLLACLILLLAPSLVAQIPETVNPGTVMPDDSVELEDRIKALEEEAYNGKERLKTSKSRSKRVQQTKEDS